MYSSIYSRRTVSESDVLQKEETNPAKTWHRTWDASVPSVDPSAVGSSLIRNGLHGRVAVKKPFLRKGNRAKRLSYAKWQKKWTENQWQQVLWRDESSPEPGPQHYWSSVGLMWQRTEQKAANIQRRALGCPSRSLDLFVLMSLYVWTAWVVTDIWWKCHINIRNTFPEKNVDVLNTYFPHFMKNLEVVQDSGTLM